MSREDLHSSIIGAIHGLMTIKSFSYLPNGAPESMLSASDAKEVRLEFIDCSEIDDILKRSRSLLGNVITKGIFILSEVLTLRGPSILPFFLSPNKRYVTYTT